MALSPSTISSAILSAGTDITGLTFPSLCNAIGNAIYSWASVPSNYAMTGVTAGVVGAGTVTGKLIVSPNVGIVQAGLSGKEVLGVTAPSLAKAVAIGIASVFSSSGQYTGASAGVAVGTDVSFVLISNSATLVPLMILSMFGSFGGTGASTGSVAGGLSNGIAQLLQTAQGIGIVAGTPTGSASAAGSSPISKVF